MKISFTVNMNLPDLLNAADAAGFLGMDKRSFAEERRRDGFPAPISIDGRLYWLRVGLSAWQQDRLAPRSRVEEIRDKLRAMRSR